MAEPRSIEIYRSQAFATATYRSELAREVEGLGYRIEFTGRDGRWELEGYSREQVMAFSQRRRDIEERLEREGLSGAAAAQIAAHRSRLAKRHEDEAQLRSDGGIALRFTESGPSRSRSQRANAAPSRWSAGRWQTRPSASASSTTSSAKR